MQRLVTGPAHYAHELIRALRCGWDRFFFAPADPTPLGLIRVFVGLLLFWSLLVTGLDLHAFLGSHAWVDPAALRERFDSPWAWSFWLWVPDAMLRPVWAGCLVVLALFTLGLWSRATAVLAWVIVVSTSRRAPAILYGFDNIVATWTFYLAVCGASGQAVSLDRFFARLRTARAAVATRRKDGRWQVAPGAPGPTVPANLGLRLIQLHLALIYGMAGLAKLQGAAWWNGFAAWGVVAAGEFRRFDLTWMAGYPLLLNVMTHGGLFVELTYPVLIWNRRLRPLVIAAAVFLHLGIDLTLGLTEFGLAMMAGNLAFCSGPWLRSLIAGRVQPAGRVLYDGACPRCRASMALVAAADPDRVVEPIDLTAVDVSSIHPRLTKDACLRAMHLVRADGKVVAGYDAVATLARWLPLGWPLGALGLVPGVGALGRRVYAAIAASRPRDVVCTDETCAIHPPARRPPATERTAAAAESGRKSR